KTGHPCQQGKSYHRLHSFKPFAEKLPSTVRLRQRHALTSVNYRYRQVTPRYKAHRARIVAAASSSRRGACAATPVIDIVQGERVLSLLLTGSDAGDCVADARPSIVSAARAWMASDAPPTISSIFPGSTAQPPPCFQRAK